MAFIVNVKLVEKSVKRKVGIVIVVKVIIQYRTLGKTLIKNNVICPNIPTHDLLAPACSMEEAVEFAMDMAEGSAELIVPDKPDVAASMECRRVSARAELAAILTNQSKAVS